MSLSNRCSRGSEPDPVSAETGSTREQCDHPRRNGPQTERVAGTNRDPTSVLLTPPSRLLYWEWVRGPDGRDKGITQTRDRGAQVRTRIGTHGDASRRATTLDTNPSGPNPLRSFGRPSPPLVLSVRGLVGPPTTSIHPPNTGLENRCTETRSVNLERQPQEQTLHSHRHGRRTTPLLPSSHIGRPL